METPLTPLEFARRARKLHATRTAVVEGELRLTYAEFGERCDRWSAALAKLSVRRGDRVGTIAPSTHRHLEQFYSIPQLGAVIVPMNYRLTADDFVYLANHSGCKVLCVGEDYLEVIDSVRSQMSSVEHFVALEGERAGWLDYEKALAATSGEFSPRDIDENDLIAINYTSGTTSRPKGVMITHRNAWVNSVGTLIHYPMALGDCYLWTLPMFHANGWTYTWIVTAVAGTHVCVRKVEPATVFPLINAERIAMLCAAPTVLIGLANAPESLRKDLRRGVRVLTAGAPPAAATIERIEGEFGWQVAHAYGLTETAPFITVSETRPEDAQRSDHERAVLKARQGVELITSGELRVVDEHDRDVPRDGQTLGEIVARGNVIMKGYFNDPAASAKALRGGWFRTGDAAVVHPDGYAEIRDRLKDVIISGGENISSIEVEGHLLRHPAVLEAAVVGMPHEKWGETPHAFIVVRQGRTATPEELREFCREKLAHFKVPTAFDLVTELPKTATGKIQKYVLRGGRSAISRQ
jgi:fatty-acyl-CoA synthase